MTTKLQQSHVIVAAIEMYLKDGTDHTADEIAQHLGCNAAAVRRVINAAHGCPPGLRYDHISRESFSRDYPNMQKGYHKVWVYGPTRETLRKRIRGEVCFACQAPLSEVGCIAECRDGKYIPQGAKNEGARK